jgi:putative ABC transport system permease protein
MEGLPLTIPVPTLAVFTVLAIVAGIGAAVLPARRASKLNVLKALAEAVAKRLPSCAP